MADDSNALRTIGAAIAAGMEAFGSGLTGTRSNVALTILQKLQERREQDEKEKKRRKTLEAALADPDTRELLNLGDIAPSTAADLAEVGLLLPFVEVAAKSRDDRQLIAAIEESRDALKSVFGDASPKTIAAFIKHGAGNLLAAKKGTKEDAAEFADAVDRAKKGLAPDENWGPPARRAYEDIIRQRDRNFVEVRTAVEQSVGELTELAGKLPADEFAAAVESHRRMLLSMHKSLVDSGYTLPPDLAAYPELVDARLTPLAEINAKHNLSTQVAIGIQGLDSEAIKAATTTPTLAENPAVFEQLAKYRNNLNEARAIMRQMDPAGLPPELQRAHQILTRDDLDESAPETIQAMRTVMAAGGMNGLRAVATEQRKKREAQAQVQAQANAVITALQPIAAMLPESAFDALKNARTADGYVAALDSVKNHVLDALQKAPSLPALRAAKAAFPQDPNINQVIDQYVQSDVEEVEQPAVFADFIRHAPDFQNAIDRFADMARMATDRTESGEVFRRRLPPWEPGTLRAAGEAIARQSLRSIDDYRAFVANIKTQLINKLRSDAELLAPSSPTRGELQRRIAELQKEVDKLGKGGAFDPKVVLTLMSKAVELAKSDDISDWQSVVEPSVTASALTVHQLPAEEDLKNMGFVGRLNLALTMLAQNFSSTAFGANLPSAQASAAGAVFRESANTMLVAYNELLNQLSPDEIAIALATDDPDTYGKFIAPTVRDTRDRTRLKEGRVPVIGLFGKLTDEDLQIALAEMLFQRATTGLFAEVQ